MIITVYIVDRKRLYKYDHILTDDFKDRKRIGLSLRFATRFDCYREVSVG